MDFVKVGNKNPKFGEALSYYFLRAGRTDYLFTESQLKIARQRAIRNQEDVQKRKMFDWVKSLLLRIK